MVSFISGSGRFGPFLAPFRPRTWRHVLYAVMAVGPLLLVVLPYVMKSAQGHGHGTRAVAPVLLLVMLAVVAAVGPWVERWRAATFLREEIGHRSGVGRRARLGRGLLFLVANLLLSTLSFGVVVVWAIASARNLSYPIWGWVPYPDPNWGGPSPAGAVALHFAAGVVAFFFGPWAIIGLTNWQVRVARNIFGATPAAGRAGVPRPPQG